MDSSAPPCDLWTLEQQLLNELEAEVVEEEKDNDRLGLAEPTRSGPTKLQGFIAQYSDDVELRAFLERQNKMLNDVRVVARKRGARLAALQDSFDSFKKSTADALHTISTGAAKAFLLHPGGQDMFPDDYIPPI